MSDLTPLEYAEVSKAMWDTGTNPGVSYDQDAMEVQGSGEKVAAFDAEVVKLRAKKAAAVAIVDAGYNSVEEAVAALLSAT